MPDAISPNTQAILLLTAPLIAGRNTRSSDLLSPSEYKRLARSLRAIQGQPADLLTPAADNLLTQCANVVPPDRVKRLLGRGFLLSQAIERWQARSIWVISRADAPYPKRLKSRLGEDAPPILYGCGSLPTLQSGGLAVVGSRDVDESLIAYTEVVGRNAANAHYTVVSGGARGVDQAAMRGALDAGGTAVGVLAEGLERAALNRENRSVLMDGRLTLASPHDPQSRFHVGHAMQRNKLIYALSEAALVVNADYQKGGTWAGAIEQLEKLRMVPVFVRAKGAENKGLEALLRSGALRWPDPATPEAFKQVFSATYRDFVSCPQQDSLFSDALEAAQPNTGNNSTNPEFEPPRAVLINADSPEEELFAKVRELALKVETAMSQAEFAAYLGVSKMQAKQWLKRLVNENLLKETKKPLKYAPQNQGSLL